MPKGLVHIIPDEAALVLFVLFDQGHIAFHAAQGVAHIVHVLAQNERFSRVFGHVGDDFGRLGVHAAFHIADVIELTAVEDALVMHQAAWVIGAEEVRHSTDVLASVALVAAGPDQSRHSGRLPGTFQLGSTVPSFCQLPWLSRLVSSIM